MSDEYKKLYKVQYDIQFHRTYKSSIATLPANDGGLHIGLNKVQYLSISLNKYISRNKNIFKHTVLCSIYQVYVGGTHYTVTTHYFNKHVIRLERNTTTT